jgi:hypothetical protein
VFSGRPTNIGEVRRTERGVECFGPEERAMFSTPEAGQTGKTVTFADPNFLVTAGSFATITDTRVPPRIVQLGVKYYF